MIGQSKNIKGTIVFNKNIKALKNKKSLIINWGSSRSSKSFSIVQVLHIHCSQIPNQYVIAVGSAMPKVKKTLIRDFIEIADFNPLLFNRQDATYSYPNGSVLQFMSADNYVNFIGLKTHIAFLDEVNTYRNGREIFNQLEIRNEDAIIVAFNPASKFWITDYWDLETTEVIHSTWKDNRMNLPQKVIDSLLAKEHTDPNFYKVYVLGEWGSLEGLVFKEGFNWEVVDAFPKPDEYKWHIYGLDFGFTNDPTVFLEAAYYNQMIYLRQLIWETELTNMDIAHKIHNLKIKGLTIADSAEPKSIEELWRQGINVQGAIKGTDSVRSGIDLMKGYRIGVHRDSTELIDEFRNHSYKPDKTGELTNIFDDNYNHGIDAARYAISYKLGSNKGGAKAIGVI